MRYSILLVLPAIFGIVYCRSSGEKLGYDPLKGPPQGAQGPAVVQNHGAMGDPAAAQAAIKDNGNSGQVYDYPLYDGPPKSGTGPNIVQQHGYAGAPQVSGNFGGDSGSNGGGNAVQGNNAAQQGNGGGDSQDDGAGGGAARIQPQIIPYGDDSGDVDGGTANMNGYIPPQSGGAAQTGQTGYVPPQARGDSSNSIDPAAGTNGNPLGGSNNGAAAPNAAPVAGGADTGLILERQDLRASSGMSGGAVAGVVVGVVAVGAVGTAVAVMALKSAGSPLLPA